jgi:hypothetical protein
MTSMNVLHDHHATIDARKAPTATKDLQDARNKRRKPMTTTTKGAPGIEPGTQGKGGGVQHSFKKNSNEASKMYFQGLDATVPCIFVPG